MMAASLVLIETFLNPKHTFCRVSAHSQKKLFQTIGNLLAQTDPQLRAHDIYQGLLERERLGCTSIGKGVALPHCRLPDIKHITGCLITLTHPIDFNSLDNQEVDITFALLVPQECGQTHLETLATLATHFASDSFCDALRACTDHANLFELATTYDELAITS